MDLKKSVFAVVTGASQGIGRAIALELSRHLGDGSSVTLIARNAQALNNVKAEILVSNTNVNVKVVALDLTNPSVSEYEKIFSTATKCDYAIIFHNAAQVGTLNATTELTDLQQWRNYFDLNLFSAGILNSVFVKCMRKLLIEHILVVNISSLSGVQPFFNMAMYCSVKAARNLYFKVFALEDSDVKVLNYCPGPVDTDMVTEIIANIVSDDGKKVFVDYKEKQLLLTPAQTVEKLLGILQEGSYASGDIIDYYDRL